MSERIRQPFIIDNRPGAGGNIATEAVVRAPPDGYTLLLAGHPNAIGATLYDKLTYNFLKDTVPVAGVARGPMIIVVNPSVPAKTLVEFIAYAKANPGKINFGSGGIGTGTHLSGELFKMIAGVNMVHVPYRGEAPALTDLLGGQLQVVFATVTASIEYIRAGKVRALAVTTTMRSDALPDTPMIAEFLPGYEAGWWYGVVAPKNMPAEIIDRLNREINTGLANSKMQARFADLGAVPLALSPAEFGKFICLRNRKVGQGDPGGQHQGGVIGAVEHLSMVV